MCFALYILFYFLPWSSVLLDHWYGFPQPSLQKILKMIPLFSKYRMFLTLRNWRNGNFTLCHFSNVLIGILFSNILTICMFVQTWKQSIHERKAYKHTKITCFCRPDVHFQWERLIIDLIRFEIWTSILNLRLQVSKVD